MNHSMTFAITWLWMAWCKQVLVLTFVESALIGLLHMIPGLGCANVTLQT